VQSTKGPPSAARGGGRPEGFLSKGESMRRGGLQLRRRTGKKSENSLTELQNPGKGQQKHERAAEVVRTDSCLPSEKGRTNVGHQRRCGEEVSKMPHAKRVFKAKTEKEGAWGWSGGQEVWRAAKSTDVFIGDLSEIKRKKYENANRS